MTYEQVNNRALLESLAKRRRKLTESNAKILDWAMKIVSNEKKVPLPQIRISNCVPYTVVPLGETNLILPFLNPNPNREGPSEPCKEPAKNKVPSIRKKKELTPVEEVEEYLRMEAAKEKAVVDQFLYIDQISATVIKGLLSNPNKGIKNLLTKIEHVCS